MAKSGAKKKPTKKTPRTSREERKEIIRNAGDRDRAVLRRLAEHDRKSTALRWQGAHARKIFDQVQAGTVDVVAKAEIDAIFADLNEAEVSEADKRRARLEAAHHRFLAYAAELVVRGQLRYGAYRELRDTYFPPAKKKTK